MLENRKMPSHPIITLTTDFGTIYPARMKGKILSECPDANIIDITHGIPAGNIQAGAFILAQCAQDFPEKTIHVAVVDPGVGSSRKALMIHNKKTDQYFIGPDNGILISTAFRNCEDDENNENSDESVDVFEIDEAHELFKDVSATFHGKDIFAPVAAFLANGSLPENIGKRILLKNLTGFSDLKKKTGNTSLETDSEIIIKTNVLLVDDFGNMITSYPCDEKQELKEQTVEINLTDSENCKKSFPALFVRTYSDAPEGSLVLLRGSFGNLEIAINCGSAKNFFKKEEMIADAECKIEIIFKK